MYQLNYINVNTLLYRTGAVNNYSTSQTRQTSLFFKAFLAGSPTYALPVGFIKFDVQNDLHKVYLNWATASEINNDYFTIERSPDAVNFTEINKMKGAGSSASTRYYYAEDTDPLDGMSYYRLKQTDFDGKYSYSEIIPILRTAPVYENMELESVSPNPFGTTVQIEFSLKESCNVDIIIMNNSGRIIDKACVFANPGNNKYRFFEKYDMSPGTYFVMIEKSDQRLTSRLVKE
jgi:hypothetical protein